MLGELVGLAALAVDPVHLVLHFPLVYRLIRRSQEAANCRKKCQQVSVEILIFFCCNSEEGLMASFNRLVPFIQSEVISLSYRPQHKQYSYCNISHMELCKAPYILCFLKNLFPPVTGLFLQFIFLEKCLSGEYIFQSVSSGGGEESSTTDKNRSGEEEEYSSFSWKKLVVFLFCLNVPLP